MKDKRDLVSKHRYNEEYIKGKFGEYLVMYQLMVYRGWDVEYVDYFGADLIAIDTLTFPSKKYAIQVKLRHFFSDGQTNSDFDAEQKLRVFCKNYSTDGDPLIPLVAYVNINHDQSINTFIINVNDLSDIRCEMEQLYGGCSKHGIGTSHKNDKNSGYICNSNTGLKYLINDPRVTYYRLADFDMKKTPLDNVGHRKNLSYLRGSVLRKRDKKTNYVGNQIGDFGEWFFMMKAVASGYCPFLIKSIGADILLFDSMECGSGQAISVKTFSKEENDQYEFEFSNAQKLKEFSTKWNLKKEPLVVLQQMIYRSTDGKKEYYKMYNFTMSLSYLENTNKEYISKSNTGYILNWKYDNLLKIQNDADIAFDMVVFDEPFIYEQIREKKTSKRNLNNKILRICDEKNISINELSTRVGIAKKIIDKIVNNEYIPSLEVALRISNVLGITVNELFTV